MKAILEAPKAAFTALTAAGLSPRQPHETPPASGNYQVVTVISAPPANDWQGAAFRTVRLQIDAWALAKAGSAAVIDADKAQAALEAAGFTCVPSGAVPLSFEGTKDDQDRLWWRCTLDVIREF